MTPPMRLTAASKRSAPWLTSRLALAASPSNRPTGRPRPSTSDLSRWFMRVAAALIGAGPPSASLPSPPYSPTVLAVALTGSRYELPVTARVREGLDAEARRRVVDLTGQTPLARSPLLDRSSIVVSNDTGVAHPYAAAVGARTVTVFGGSDRQRWELRAVDGRCWR